MVYVNYKWNSISLEPVKAEKSVELVLKERMQKKKKGILQIILIDTLLKTSTSTLIFLKNEYQKNVFPMFFMSLISYYFNDFPIDFNFR